MSTTSDPDLRVVDETGMQKKYPVMADHEREQGFIRPVRTSYIHLPCGGVTTMGQSIAETYARDPQFYGGTFCAMCKDHYPVGPDGEFVWSVPRKSIPLGTQDKVGT